MRDPPRAAAAQRGRRGGQRRACAHYCSSIQRLTREIEPPRLPPAAHRPNGAPALLQHSPLLRNPALLAPPAPPAPARRRPQQENPSRRSRLNARPLPLPGRSHRPSRRYPDRRLTRRTALRRLHRQAPRHLRLLTPTQPLLRDRHFHCLTARLRRPSPRPPRPLRLLLTPSLPLTLRAP